MSAAPGILTNMSRGWKRDPAGVTLGTEATGVSAALWTHDQNDVQEVWAEPDTENNIVAIQLGSPFAEVRFDEREAYADRVPTGGFQIVAAGVRPHMITKGRWQVLHLYLPQQLMRRLTQSCELPDHEFLDPKCSSDIVVRRIGQEMMAEMREGQPLSRLRVDALGQDLAIQLLRRWSNLAGTRALARELEQQRRGGLAPWQLRRVTDCLEANLADDLPLAVLAQLVGLSPNHFCTAFRITMGEPPHRWLVRRRIERAKEMLADPRLNVTDVALAVGFGSSAHFATAFRKQAGVTPSTYRREVLR